MGNGDALVPGHLQLLQRPSLRNTLFMRHIRLLCRMYLPSKRRSGPHPTTRTQPNLPVPIHHGRPACPHSRLGLWYHWRKHTIPALRP